MNHAKKTRNGEARESTQWVRDVEREAVARMIDMFGTSATARAIGVTTQTIARIRDAHPVSQGTALLVRVRLAEIAKVIGGESTTAKVSV
jgi:hypothetical protein